jgi:hypothetical protein
VSDWPVQTETMLFTLVDPHRGHEVAYNRWYERDHFYAGCMVGPWLFAGGRFVATRELKELRFPEGGGFVDPLDAGSYLAIYWIHRDHVDEHLAWAGRQVRELYAAGRGFEQRSHAHTGLYDLATVVAPEIPLELSLDHRFGGLAVLVVEPAVPDAALALAERAPAAASSSWWGVRRSARTREAKVPMALGSEGGSEDRLLQLTFLDEDPREWWPECRRYAASLEEDGMGRVTFAAPFLPTDVGTDRYTDQLW